MKSNISQLDGLIEVILKIKNKKDLENFLQGIFTPKELVEIPNRIKIVKLLKKGVAHQEIATKLHVGVATVTRGARELKVGRFKDV